MVAAERHCSRSDHPGYFNTTGSCPYCVIELQESQLKTYRVRLDAAEGALRKYGRHASGCAYVGTDCPFTPCDCGLEQALHSDKGKQEG